MRHSFASIQLRAGTSLKVVSDILGHTTISTTADLYTHVLGDLKSEAADRLDAIFEEAEDRLVIRAREQGSWANCGPIESRETKKARCYGPSMVAPTGIEMFGRRAVESGLLHFKNYLLGL